MIPTFIYEADNLVDDHINPGDSESHHIISVLRLGKGDMVRMVDGQGTAHICEISSIGSKKVSCRIIKTVINSGEPGLKLTLAVGLSTSSKFDTVIEKGTEVGVCRFIPLLSEKAKVKLDKSAISRKMKRWRRICEAAVKQSGRSKIPEIAEPVDCLEFLSGCEKAGTILFHPGEGTRDIGLLADLKGRNDMTIVVGPESGFSRDEVSEAENRGIAKMSLGPRVLRTETAGVVIPALVIYLSEIVKA